jgi:hypothetical protein
VVAECKRQWCEKTLKVAKAEDIGIADPCGTDAMHWLKSICEYERDAAFFFTSSAFQLLLCACVFWVGWSKMWNIVYVCAFVGSLGSFVASNIQGGKMQFWETR